MKPDLTHGHQDIATNQKEEYNSFLRALRRSRGFGILFVRCSPAKEERLIERVRGDLPQKSIEVLTLEEPVENFYQRVEMLPNREQINILFVQGLELSFYDYEQRKRQEGWDSQEIYSYSWKGVPPVLVNLNQQRERFRDNFRFVMVFLLPIFGIDYFIRRAPDFFDWRSGLFEFYDISEFLSEELTDFALTVSPQNIQITILEIEGFLKYNCPTLEKKTNLLQHQGVLFFRSELYEEGIASFDKALELNPDNFLGWGFRAIALENLGRYSEAVASYDKALALKPDYPETWYFRARVLGHLGRYSEAVASYDKALELKPNYYKAWYVRANVLGHLGRYSEAVASYDKALALKPDYYEAWYFRANILGHLGRYSEAVASYDQALAVKPDYSEGWYFRAIALENLGRYSEAVANYDKALELNPDNYQVWVSRAIALENLERYSKSVASYEKAAKINPELSQND